CTAIEQMKEARINLREGGCQPPSTKGVRGVQVADTETSLKLNCAKPNADMKLTSAASRPTPILAVRAGSAISVASTNCHAPPAGFSGSARKTSATAWKSGGVTPGA